MSQIVFPKPLPEVIKQNVPHETGFTTTEVVGLQNAWRIIKRRIYFHTHQIFLSFYTENCPLLEKFRTEDGKFNLTALHQHTLQILQIYGNLIEGGLNDPIQINLYMSEVVSKHKRFGVNFENVKFLNEFILKYFLKYSLNRSSYSLEKAAYQLSDLINAYHQDLSEQQIEKA